MRLFTALLLAAASAQSGAPQGQRAAAARSGTPAPAATPNPVPRLTVKVDPRIELMAVTEILADYGWTGLLKRADTPYRRDVDAWFAPFKNHPAIRRFNELAHAGYNFDGPASTMMCLSPPPELALQAPAEQCEAKRAGGAASLNSWLEQLRAFSRESDFMTFFRAHAGLYSTMEDATRKLIQQDYAAHLESYFGVKQASYNIVLAPLLAGNFGPRRARPDGSYDIYGILGSTNQGPIAQFGTTESLRHLVWHEFGHSFVNPEVERAGASLAKSSKLLTPIAARMRSAAYSNWQTVVIEHVDRAVTVRLASRELGDAAGRTALIQERANGFAYVEALAERLREYERNRDRYPTFRDFTPRLLAVFDELATRDLPPDFYDAPPTINGAVLSSSAVIVIPTGENDPAIQQKIHEYVRGMQQRFFRKAEVITDEQALARDLSSFGVIVYGTLTGNKWLARYRDLLPATAVLERAKEPGPLRLIAVMPNPANPKLFGVAYTGVEAAAIPGINELYAGPTAWVIGRERNVISSGYYSRQNGKWVAE